MANELSRISERLIRARERSGHGASRVWVPPPARREPTRRELPAEREPPQKPRQDAGQSPATWVAIHVQLRHEPSPTQSVFDAPPERDEDEDDDYYVEAAAVEHDEPLAAPRALPAPAAGDTLLIPKVFASEATTSGKQTRASGIFQYLATRALNAYLTHSSFASVGTGEPRLLDVHA